MISKEKIEAKLAALPAKSGHARILRRKLEKRFPEVSAPPVVEDVVEPVVEEVVEPVAEEVEEQPKKRVTRKKKKD